MALAVYIEGRRRGSLKEQGFITLFPPFHLNLCERDNFKRVKKRAEGRLAPRYGRYAENSKESPRPISGGVGVLLLIFPEVQS